MNPIESLIKQGESKTLEFVTSLNDKDIISSHVAALLNSGGGRILIGVDDNKRVAGIPEAEKVAGELQAFLIKAISPKALFSVGIEQVQGEKQIIVIDVPGGKDTPFVANERVYLRRGPRTLAASGDDLQMLLQRRSAEVERWERRSSPVLTMEDLDKAEIQRTIQDVLAGNRFEFRHQEDPEAIFSDLGMWNRGMLTNAADVCFGQRPAVRNPQIRVRAFALQTDKGGDYLDQADLNGPVTQVIEQARAFIHRNSPLTAQFRPDSLQRQNLEAYPDYVVREGLVNALAHRDYASFSSGATVLVYPARVEIWNSGRLPMGWRADKLRTPHASIPANPDIAHFLYIRNYMERIGRGTNKMIETCREMGLPAPTWAVDEDGITLTLHSRASIEAPGLNLNKRQNRLLTELSPGNAITLSDYLKRFAGDVGDRQARRDLKELEAADLLKLVGKGRAAHYERTARNWKE